jgi:enoyl-CoA hydratase/carnithine racemase
MDFGTVLYESKDRVATITLNRPERFNAINETMPEDIAAAFNYANNDDSTHVVVLTGAGRGFCGGYDLKTYAETSGTNPVIPLPVYGAVQPQPCGYIDWVRKRLNECCLLEI